MATRRHHPSGDPGGDDLGEPVRVGERVDRRDGAVRDRTTTVFPGPRVRLASIFVAAVLRPRIAPNGTSNTSWSTNETRSAGVRASMTTYSARPTESAARCPGPDGGGHQLLQPPQHHLPGTGRDHVGLTAALVDIPKQ